MNIVQVRVNVHNPDNPDAVAVPVVVPDLIAVRALAERLHAEAQAYSDLSWGWPVQYEPELREDAAEFQVPDGRGG